MCVQWPWRWGWGLVRLEWYNQYSHTIRVLEYLSIRTGALKLFRWLYVWQWNCGCQHLPCWDALIRGLTALYHVPPRIVLEHSGGYGVCLLPSWKLCKLGWNVNLYCLWCWDILDCAWRQRVIHVLSVRGRVILFRDSSNFPC